MNVIKKAQSVSDVEKAFELCRKFRIRSLANIMINLPTEEEEDLRLTRDLLKKIRPNQTLFAVTTPYPGTPIYDKYLKPPLKKEEYHLLRVRSNEKRFRFANHHVDFDEALYDWKRLSALVPGSLKMWLNIKYLKYVVRSKKILAILRLSIKRARHELPLNLAYKCLSFRLFTKLKSYYGELYKHRET